MAADGPPSNLGVDKTKVSGKNHELNSTSNNGSVIMEYTPQVVSFSAGDVDDDLKIFGYYSTDTDSEPKEKNPGNKSKHKPPSEVQPKEMKGNIPKFINKMMDKNHQTNPRNSMIMNFDNNPISPDDIIAELPPRENCRPRGSFSGESKNPLDQINPVMQEYVPMIPSKSLQSEWRTSVSPKISEHKDAALSNSSLLEGSHPSTDNKRNSTDDESKHSENTLEQQRYDEIKESNLLFIRKYEPTFEFKKDSAVSMKDRMKNLNDEFCEKCEQLTKDYEADTEKEDKKRLQIGEEIRQFNLAIKESTSTCSELKEALRKTDLELYIDSDILYNSYQDLRNNVRDYLESQSCRPEHLDSMIQILLDHVICSHPFPPLKVIEELFISSKHTSWIAHARDQIISLLLKQNNPQVNTPLLIEMFEQKHRLSLTPNELLEKAIECAHRLSKYAIAPETYFNDDLSLEGLASLNKKKIVMTAEPEPLEASYRVIESNSPLPPPRTSVYKLQVEPLKQALPPILKREEKELPLINERPSAPPPPTHAEQIPHVPVTHPPNNSGRRPSNYQIHHIPDERLLQEWEGHLNNQKGCLLCAIENEHRIFENSPAFRKTENGCFKKNLCNTCRAVKDHRKKCDKKGLRKKCNLCQPPKQAEKKKPFFN